MLVDTHCHLSISPLLDDISGVIARAREKGVERIVVPAFDLASWDLVESLGQRPGVYSAFGLHPWLSDTPLDEGELCRRLNGACAVGEIGLDFKIDKFDADQQEKLFRVQLELAISKGLPVLLHCRGAFEEMLRILAEYRGRVRGVIHAFSRGPQLAARFVELGLYVAFGGAVTRSRANRAQRAASSVPLDRILLETDAPSIGLDGVPPEKVEPHHIFEIARAIAELRGESLDTIAKCTTENACQLFDFN